MCNVHQSDWMNPALTMVMQQQGYGGMPGGINSGVPVNVGGGQQYGIYRYHDKYDGYVKHGTYDKMDAGLAPKGFYSQYRFGKDGQIVGSADGKTFNPIDGLKLDFNEINKLYKPTEKPARPRSLADMIYSSSRPDPDTADNAKRLFADGGIIRDFKVDDNGNLFARINSDNQPRTQASQAIAAISGKPQDPAFEGYVPISGYQLEASEDGNLKAGRSVFFDPTGLAALNAAIGEEYSGMHIAYSRKKGSGPQPQQPQQALKQADKVNLKTGTRGGG